LRRKRETLAAQTQSLFRESRARLSLPQPFASTYKNQPVQREQGIRLV
jgi:hypothetical protein